MTFKIKTHIVIISLAYVLFWACGNTVEPLDDQVSRLNLQTLPPVTDPANNISTIEKQELGRLLFWDPILSGEKDVSCATCHHPELGYADALDLSIGVGGEGLGEQRIETASERIPRVLRNAPTVINSAYNSLLDINQSYQPLNGVMFWDGRVRSLENQSLGPPESFNEMRGNAYAVENTYDSIVARLRAIPEYVQLFNNSFGEGENSISRENIGKAIASFERNIVSTNSPYDQYVRGDESALTEVQKEGALLFFGKGNCASCHVGPMFSDYNFYNLGIDDNDAVGVDEGVEQLDEFRTPTLRNITLTAPYMHNGVLATLRDVMDFYNDGVSQNERITSIDPKIKPLRLTENEIDAIISFMESLTDEDFDREIPESVPSGLKVGGNL